MVEPPGTLAPKRSGHALVGLRANHDGVLAEFAHGGLLERQMRGALEHHGDFGYTLAEALAATQVERHASPAAGVDIEAGMAAYVSVVLLGSMPFSSK